MDIFTSIAEERIRKDIEGGGFSNLPGKGRPLRLDDDAMVPEDLRMAFKILKNAGFSPPEVTDRKELVSLVDLLENSPEERDRFRQIRKLNVLVQRIQARGNRQILLEEQDEYYQKAVARISLATRTVAQKNDDDSVKR